MHIIWDVMAVVEYIISQPSHGGIRGRGNGDDGGAGCHNIVCGEKAGGCF